MCEKSFRQKKINRFGVVLIALIYNTTPFFSNSLSMYFFFDFELNNGRMKVQVKRAFKRYFLSPKNFKTAHRLCMKFSSTFKTSVQRCLYPLFKNQRPHFLLLHLFLRMFQPSGQDQQNGKRAYCQ